MSRSDSGTERPATETSGAHAFRVVSASSDADILIFSSEKTGAEIYIHGKFVGDTPSTISLVSGTH